MRAQDVRGAVLALAVVLFIATWPLEKRHLVTTEYSFVTGAFTEATTMALYASDIAFLLLGLSWLWQKVYTLRGMGAEGAWQATVPRAAFWSGAALVAWAVIRALPLHPSLLGWYGAVRVAQGFLLFLLVADLWTNVRIHRIVLWTLVFAGSAQAVLGTAQVFSGHDQGLRFLGETELSTRIDGIAEVDIIKRNTHYSNVPGGTSGTDRETVPTGTKVLRAYGTFQHPNVLGSFLVSTLAALTLLITKQETFGPVPIGTSAESKSSATRGFLRMITLLGAVIVSVGTLLTFSRSAWISAVTTVSLFFSCSHRNIDKYVKGVITLSILAIVLTVGFIPNIREASLRRIVPNGVDRFLEERLNYALTVLRDRNPIDVLVGIGTGNWTPWLVRNARNIDYIEKRGETITDSWVYQYPHSVPLVLLAELGVVGCGLFAVFVWSVGCPLFVRVQKRSRAPSVRIGPIRASATTILGVGLVLGVAAPFLVDHFLWTTQQGRILLWGILGVIASSTHAPPRATDAPRITLDSPNRRS